MRSRNPGLVDEALKCLRGVSDPEVHIVEFEKPKRRVVGCFFCAVRKIFFKIGNVPNGILVGERSSVQCTIVAAGCPAVFYLGDDVIGEAQVLSERRAVPFRSIFSN
jgi:metal-sulfur cluster biosynthetic enzyme